MDRNSTRIEGENWEREARRFFNDERADAESLYDTVVVFFENIPGEVNTTLSIPVATRENLFETQPHLDPEGKSISLEQEEGNDRFFSINLLDNSGVVLESVKIETNQQDGTARIKKSSEKDQVQLSYLVNMLQGSLENFLGK